MTSMIAPLLLAVALASQPPTPTPAKAGNIKQSQPSSTSNATQTTNPPPQSGPTQAANPLTSTSPNAPGNQGHNEDKDTPSNRWIAFFTAILTIVAFLQWWTSDAQRRLLMSVERAYLNPVGWKIQWGDDAAHSTITTRLSNSGNTSAVITAISTTMHYGEVLPERPVYRNTHVRNLPIGARETISQPSSIALNQKAIGAIQSGSAPAWFYGYFIYMDAFGREHGYAFCGVYDHAEKTFVRESKPGYTNQYEYPRTRLGRLIARALARPAPPTLS